MALSHACVSAMLSSSRSVRLRPSWLPSLLDLRAGRGLELLASPLRRRHAVLDRLADRVVGVGHDRPRPLRGFFCLLHGLARRELDGLAAQVVDLAATRTRRDVCACDQPEHSAEQKPTKPAAAAIVFCHRSYLTSEE